MHSRTYLACCPFRALHSPQYTVYRVAPPPPWINLKGTVSRDFSLNRPIWAPDWHAAVFSNMASISRRYSNGTVSSNYYLFSVGQLWLRDVNDTAELDSVVSPLSFLPFWISPRKWIYLRIYFSVRIRGPTESWKKREVKNLLILSGL